MELNIAFSGFSAADKAAILRGLLGYGISVFNGAEPYDVAVCAPPTPPVSAAPSANFTATRPHLAAPAAKLAVTLSCDAKVMCMLRDTGCTVVTCGTADDDTLSVSSVGEHKAAVSLQRRLITLSGRKIEPCEIPIKSKNTSNLRVFEAVTALLLLSDVPPEKGYEI
ncbi:MAG: hypothetical protein UHZ05_04185 [Acutalibacteraceae bacterium]|nr:hypothetical protein [Clostridia bacterium]MBQ2319379.1 hypothetical protein [Clostridia bacterium]MBQ2387990.1 hypothetical protein [Clostridia bacterium]MEE1127426.1 hypothetical protein [Acutalibacteraceae bacterium]